MIERKLYPDLIRDPQPVSISSLFLTSSLSSSSPSSSSSFVTPSPSSPSSLHHEKTASHGPEFKWNSKFPVIIFLILLLLSDSFSVIVSGKNFKCDFQKYPESGCQDPITTTCNSETDQCVCRPAYPVNVNGRCFAYRDITDLCVTSRQCSKIKAKCIDNAGEEVVANEETGSLPSTASPASSKPSDQASLRMMVGICKCPEGLFHHPEKNECSARILGRKCYFNTDCFQRSHSYCDGTKCKCKAGFLQDYSSDECRPSLVALCMFGYVYENGTQKCRPSSKSDITGYESHPGIRSGHPSPLSSSLSALFWPVIAFFLVILLLKMLKEGMRRDCERAAATVASGATSDPRNRHRRPRSHHHHHRSLGHHVRPFRHYPSELLPAIAGPHAASNSSSSRNRAPEIVVLMPPPPYSPTATGPEISVATGVVEEPPSYEEATRK